MNLQRSRSSSTILHPIVRIKINKDMKVNKSEFSAFLQANSTRYPYDEIKTTRRRFIVKYLFVKAVRTTEFTPQGESHIVPSSAFKPETMMHLIISKQAFPCPPVLEELVYRMENWGRGVSVSWYRQVMKLLSFNIEFGFPDSLENLYYECIEKRLDELIWRSGLSTHLQLVIHGKAIMHYHHMYRSETGEFYWLAIKSMQFVGALIQEALMTPFFESTPVPVSPVSSTSS